ARVIAHADEPHLMVVIHQRAGDIVFGLVGLVLRDVLAVVLVLPLGMERIEHDGDFHCTRSMSRRTVRSATMISRPPSKPAAGSVNIAVRIAVCGSARAPTASEM